MSSTQRNNMIDREIGPRRVGGVYQSASGDTYQVLAIDRHPDACPCGCSAGWSITVRTVPNGRPRTHSTAWGRRDRVISQPGGGA